MRARDSDEEEREEEEEEDGGGSTDVVRSLLELARSPAPRRPRHQSAAETEWLRRLVARHGCDTAAMARDRRLNPMQQTAADIARRIAKMQQQAD
ncbi:hypothetical protein CDD83_1439 [Cordyceps sp. RAO-2017]|nr:hypothetical protein CDD83_1439 [Cordyceps sp. RAO-2017]